MTTQTLEFKAEIKQLLDLMIHSIYTNRDIFLRELISNASDAIDKLRFAALTQPDVLENESAFKIKLIANRSAKTLTISDNGIGMTLDEVTDQIGTIAKSGTRAFLEEVKKHPDLGSRPELIGQFGVGFYAAFMAAHTVILRTRKAGVPATQGVLWQSQGDGQYRVEATEKAQYGTDVILQLKDDCLEYLEEYKLRELVKKYSDFVEHPITMDVTREEMPLDAEGKEIKDAKPVIKISEETLNSRKAIWTRSKSDISAEEYNEFYKHVAKDWVNPRITIHFSAEGSSEFKAILFVPEHAPLDLFMPEHKTGLQLYIKRVFISDQCLELLPDYLRFVRGVVDSSDLPLNISRETLQDNPLLARIRKNLVKKLLDQIEKLQQEDRDKYLAFYREFGRVLKEGAHSDFDNKERLARLLYFKSTQSNGEQLRSLSEYVSAMPAAQKEIYYLTGESLEQLRHSPHLEAFAQKGYEVLLMDEFVDEWVVEGIGKFQDKLLRSIAKGDVEIESPEEKVQKDQQREEKTKSFGDLISYLKETLKSEVKDVRLSSRLTQSACCLVADAYDPTANMERILQAMKQPVPEFKRILEINAEHPVYEKMNRLFQTDKNSPLLNDYARLLLDQALLTEGSKIKDPLWFTQKISALMALG